MAKDTFLEDLRKNEELLRKRKEEYAERQRYLSNLFLLPGQSLKEPEYIVDCLLPRGYLAILAGDPKIGKTCLATAIALAVATGQPFAGLETKESAVLWLSLEEAPAERTAALGTFEELKESPSLVSPEMREGLGEGEKGPIDDYPQDWFIPIPIYTSYEQIAIDTEEGIEALDYWVTETNANLIVVDPLHAAHSGRSLNDGWAARKTLQPLKHFCARRRVSALVLHHLGSRNGKPRVAENAQLSAIASMFMLLTRETATVPASKLQLACQGRGAFANRTWHFESTGPLNYKVIDSVETAERLPTAPIERAIIAVLKEDGPLTGTQIACVIPTTARTIRNAITRLRKSKRIRILKRTRQGFLYELSQTAELSHSVVAKEACDNRDNSNINQIFCHPNNHQDKHDNNGK